MAYYSSKERLSLLRPLPPTIKRSIFSIPIIPKPEINLDRLGDGLFLQGFQNCGSKDQNCKDKIVHFYLYDRQLEPLYSKPRKYIPKLGKYYAVRTPDFSRYDERDRFGIINATYKNRYLGALWSLYGRNVIPTIGWTNPDSFDVCFEGVEQGSIVSISTLGVHSDQSSIQEFLCGYKARREKISPSSIICLGDHVDGMNTDNVLFVPYKDSFGRQFKIGWQLKLF